jgi:hypothetical protein
MTISSGGNNTNVKTPTATLTLEQARKRNQLPVNLKGNITSSGMSSKISFSGGLNIGSSARGIPGIPPT